MIAPLRAVTDWCCGNTIFAIEGDPARASNALMLASIEYRPLVRKKPKEAATGLLCSVRLRDTRKVEALFARFGIDYRILCKRGLPALLQRYRDRPGLLLGVALFFAILLLSKQYIWDIQLTSPDGLSEDAVLAMLEEEGIFAGAWLPGLDLHEICRLFPARHPEISWISVNLMGTVAEIEVRAYDQGQQKPPPASSVKALVATRDGVIERMEIQSGSPCCEIGQPVFKGQLLVSCVVEHLRFTALEDACGSIFARIREEWSEEIPLESAETVTEKRSLPGKRIFLFGKTIFFRGRGSNLPGEYAIIEESYRPMLFGRRLPITVTRQYAALQTTCPKRLTAEEALSIAEDKLAARLEAEFPGCDLLEKESRFESTEDSIRLTWKLLLLTDIAAPIEVGLQK